MRNEKMMKKIDEMIELITKVTIYALGTCNILAIIGTLYCMFLECI